MARRGAYAYGGERSQEAERRTMNIRDQFGRMWLVNIDKETGDPVAGMFPAGWTDPLETPLRYIKATSEGMRAIEVRLLDWAADQDKALERHVEFMHNIGRSEMDIGYDPDNPHPSIVRRAGPKPFPPGELLRLAAGGDKRLLGLEPMPCAVADYLGWVARHGKDQSPASRYDPDYDAFVATDPKWPEFLNWHKHRGITTKEASRRWNERTAAAQEG